VFVKILPEAVTMFLLIGLRYLLNLGQKFTFGIIPNPIWVLLICAILAYIILAKLRIGRYFYAVGNNPEATAHVGINVRRTKVLGFVLCTMFISTAGIVSASTIRMVISTTHMVNCPPSEPPGYVTDIFKIEYGLIKYIYAFHDWHIDYVDWEDVGPQPAAECK
jgi:hypothetical protein